MTLRTWLFPLVLLSAASVAHPMQASDVGIRVDSATVAAGGRVDYRVQVTDRATGQPVTDAKVTLSFRKTDGSDSAGTPMQSGGDGYYSGSLRFPKGGDWTVHISSGSTTIDLAQTVPDFAPTTTTAGSGESSSGGSDGGSAWVVAAVIGGALVVVAIGAAAVRRRRAPRPRPAAEPERPEQPEEPTSDEGPDTEGTT